jgi:CelD/BcsL family acetyltransferase involved in cellulose biosynthesis
MLRVEPLDGGHLFERLREPWKSLVEDSSTATPFQTYEWQSTWFETLGGGKHPRVVCVYEGNDLVGLMPFVKCHGLWRTLRPMGIGPSDYLHPVARDGYEEPVAAQLAEAIRGMKDIDLVDLHQIRETRSLADRFGHDTSVHQATCLVLDLPETYDAYLAMLGKSLRYDVRKLDKSLFQSGRAHIVDPAPGELDQAFGQFLELHKARWKKRGLPGAFFGANVRFQRRWLPLAEKNGWLRLRILSLDGKPIGAIYALAMHGTTYYYQAGFNPGEGSISPGTLLVAQTIRRSIEEGIKRFDFMRGDEPYKRRWKPQHCYDNRRVVFASGSWRGSLGVSWNSWANRVELRMRARLEGGGSPKGLGSL